MKSLLAYLYLHQGVNQTAVFAFNHVFVFDNVVKVTNDLLV